MREPPKVVTCSNAGIGRSVPVQMVVKPVSALADWFAAGPAPVLVAVLADANAWHAIFVAFHGRRVLIRFSLLSAATTIGYCRGAQATAAYL